MSATSGLDPHIPDTFERLAKAVAEAVWTAHKARLPAGTVRRIFLEVVAQAEEAACGSEAS